MLLNVHSYYSLRYGTLSIEQLIILFKELGYDTAVLTDINNSSAALDFVQACNEAGIKGIPGMEFRNGNKLLYIAIAKTEKGFQEINELMTKSNLNNIPLPERAPDFNNVYVVYPFGSINVDSLKDNEYIGVKPSHLNKLLYSGRVSYAKYVIWQPLTFMNDDGYRLHYNLRAIKHNCLRTQLTGEQVAGTDERLVSKVKLLKLYEYFPEVISSTRKILESCSFNMDLKEVKNKKVFTASKYDDKMLLEKLAYEGMHYRYGRNNKEAQKRVNKELEIIDKLGFSSYFLITWDIVRYGMSRGFYHVGRGSGANSVVAYCLRITDVCPIELDLYFERFLNPKRKSPPDFDIDFGWDERDDIYDYIFKRHGAKHTALMGAMSTFKDRSIIRELGKVYGLPKAEIDRIIDDPNNLLNKNEIVDILFNLYSQVEDFPNQRTIHSSGVLISEEPITAYCALDMPPKGLPTAQFDMYTAEEIGFEKFDILSQRGISHIKEGVQLVKENKGVVLDIHNFESLKRDKKIKSMLKAGKTIGSFYVESPAMRQLLVKLKCEDYLTLVAASSIIRPGVSRSGMMKAYIERFHDPSKISYLHPIMEEQLKETYGVMCYQEDVLKMGIHFFDLDGGDADFLRRMMSGKSRGRHHLEAIKKRAIDNALRKGIDRRVIDEMWRQMESFAGYSFSKAHSASFAKESFQSLALLAHYPIEFYVGVINNFGGFYSTRVYVNEVKKYGATVHLPCINKSLYKTTLYGTDLYLGFVHIKDLENQFAHLIAHERENNGEFQDLENFILRTGISLEQGIILIRIGAFRFTGKNKKELLWEAHNLLSEAKYNAEDSLLFQTRAKSYTLPSFETNILEDAYDEMEILGFVVSTSEFELLKTSYRGELKANNLIEHTGKTVRILGSYVARKPVMTIKNEYMAFGTFLDEAGNFFDTVHFPPSLKAYPLKGGGVYLIEGKVVEDFGFASIEVDKCARLPIKEDPRST